MEIDTMIKDIISILEAELKDDHNKIEIDSLQALEIAVYLENSYNISLSAEELEEIDSITLLRVLLQNKIK